MRLQQLIEYQTITNNIIFIHKKPKYKFTEFIISGYLSFYSVLVNEARLYNPSGFKQSGKSYEYKVEFMKDDLNLMIERFDEFVLDNSIITDLNIIIITSSIEFLKELYRFIHMVSVEIEEYRIVIDYKVANGTMTDGHIKRFNNINSDILRFNNLIELLNEMFEKPISTSEIGLVFNGSESKYQVLLNQTLSFKIEPLKVPEEPVIITHKLDESDIVELIK